jgi:hypothetical protein
MVHTHSVANGGENNMGEGVGDVEEISKTFSVIFFIRLFGGKLINI